MIRPDATERLYELFKSHPDVRTDTRRIGSGSIFFALRGERFDGNRFAAAALEAGAAAAVVDDPSAVADDRYILVDNVLEALQALARHHRRRLGIPIVAIAGSNGKTTTKELVSRVLARRYRIRATQGNLNNHIGVPLTLLQMDASTELGIVEMGASACGEIALLCSIAEPDFGLLTNVGRAHLEGFGGVEGVRRGKGELFDWLAARGGLAFIPDGDATLVSMAAERPGLRAEYFSAQAADGLEHRLEGEYNRRNIASAVAVGRHFGVAEAEIAAAIASYVPDNNRSQRVRTARNTLIVDCYNANPSSMQASVGNFLHEAAAAGARRVAILGDMLELGAWSQAEHTEAIRQALADPHVQLLLVGGEFTRAFRSLGAEEVEKAKGTKQAEGTEKAERAESAEGSERVRCFDDCEALNRWLDDNPLCGCDILIKGSRGIGLERCLGKL